MTINTHTGRFTFLVNSAILFVAALIAVLLLSTGVAHAQPERAANVHFASGYVVATAPGASARELAKGDAVYSADRVDTAENGRVQMRFTDGGLVSLMPNTTFSVDEYLHEGKADDDASLVFGLLKGGLRTVTGTIGQVQHDQYELKTPVATLGIRGTEYVAVLRPANTLRVHVGRGKVVITNDQGSLEVPEGRNAVVTLGSAPEFSEQGPQYQATSPMGDRLTATSQHHQDPHLLDPRANMPDLGEHSFVGLPVNQGTPPSPTPPPAPAPTPTPTPQPPTPQPPVPEPPLPEPPLPEPPLPEPPLPEPPLPEPSLPEPSLPEPPVPEPPVPEPPVPEPPLPEPPTPPGSVMIDAIAVAVPEFSNTFLLLLPPDDIDASGWNPPIDLGSSGALSWGVYEGGTGGTINGDPVILGSGSTLPYIVGNTPALTLPPGQLNYSLDGATQAHDQFGGMGTLNTFDLGIDLGTQTYSLDFDLTMYGMQVYTGNTTGGTLSTALPEGFSFTDTVQNSSYCDSGCPLGVQGFLAGPNAEQAGVVYQIKNANSESITGAAALSQ